MSLTALLSYHAVVFYIYPIAIASFYFDKKLNMYALSITIIGVIVGMTVDYILRFIGDANLHSWNTLILFGMAPRVLSLVAMSSIFFQRSEKQAKIIENEQVQEKLIEQMNVVKREAATVAKTLTESMDTLSTVTQTTYEANYEIGNSTNEVVAGSSETLHKLEVAENNVNTITSNVTTLAERSMELKQLASDVYELTKGNEEVMDTAVESMQEINENAIESKGIIMDLEEKSKEISKIVDLINGISSQTNLLSLNAGIEAARAGEHGAGFAVVSSEIRKLSEQTTKAVENIASIIEDVLQATEEAAKVMNKSAENASRGLVIIKQAKDATQKVAESNQLMNQKIGDIAQITTETEQNSKTIYTAVEQAKKISSQNMDDLTAVAAATEEEVASMDELNNLVVLIQGTAERIEEMIAR